MEKLRIETLKRSNLFLVLIFSASSIFFACEQLVEPMSMEESFENMPSGPLSVFNSEKFVWECEEGAAEITTKKYKHSANSLRIFGGKNQAVVMIPSVEIGQHGVMTFWAERWTRRDPYKFRVLGFDNNEWSEIFNGDEAIETGNFPSFVEIPLNRNRFLKYKFTCTSPENTGMLIDDVKIYNNAPLTLDSVSIHHVAVPILKRNQQTPILQVQVHTRGVAGVLDLNRLIIDLSGTSDLNDLKKVGLHYTGSDPRFSMGIPVIESVKVDEEVTFEVRQPLKYGTNYFWVSAQLSEKADIKHVVDAACKQVKIGDKTIYPENSNPVGENRLGIALRKHNDEAVDTYRIPGLATTNKGTLIAVYDIRRNSATDLQEDVDIGMNRSADGGKTWEPMKVIMDMGDWGGLPDEENGIGDPSILVDRETNTIWVAAVWAHGHPGKRNWWASKPGMSPKETSQIMLVKSDDDGLTWSEEMNITGQIKDPKWHLLLQGPGKGITLKNGALVFPAQYKDENEMPHATIIWSFDHGKSWTIGTGAKENTTEAQVIELNDGSLMLNMRDNRNRADQSQTNGRSVYITNNLGKTWTKHATSRTNALQEPTCMASLIKEEFIVNGKQQSLVLFSNPNSKTGRHHLSIKVSFDNGESWDLNKTLLLDSGTGRGYSCMTRVDDHTVGILYEGSQADMTFQLISIADLVGGQ